MPYTSLYEQLITMHGCVPLTIVRLWQFSALHTVLVCISQQTPIVFGILLVQKVSHNQTGHVLFTVITITMRGSSAFEKNYQEKQVFHSKLSAGATCPNEQQLGRLEICSGFLDVIVSQYFTFRTQRNDSKTHNYASVV